MKGIRFIITGITSLIAAILLCCYLFFLFGVPKLFSSQKCISKIENILLEKTSIPFEIDMLNLKTFPNLDVEVNVKALSAKNSEDKNIGNVEDIYYRVNLFNFRHGVLNLKYVYADIMNLKKYFAEKKSDSKTIDILKYYPAINIERAKIKLAQDTYIDVDYIKSEKEHGKIISELLAKLTSPYTKQPVTIGKDGKIIYESKGLSFKDFSVQLDNASLYLSGDTDLIHISGKDLPVRELESSFLYFYELKNPNKRNFIENFSDFHGKMDISLDYKNNEFYGNCIARDLGAIFSGFRIPVVLPEVVFDFDGREISASASGTFGGSKVKTDFKVSGLLTKDLELRGNVYSPLTNITTQKYYPAVHIDGHADAKVSYLTKGGKGDVEYILIIPKGSNLRSSYGGLDNIDKIRRISMHTNKQGEKMSIDSYHYSVYSNNHFDNILLGNGAFEKNNGHYKLSYVTLKSNERVSVNYIKSFLKDYLKDGMFDANLRYDFAPRSLVGSMNLYNVSHSDFLHLSNTKVRVAENKILLDMEGTFYGSPLKAKASADSDFRKTFHVYDIDVHLDSFLVQKGKLTSIPKTFKQNDDIPKIKTSKRIDVIVDKGNVKVDRIYSRKFDVRNVSMQGDLKNDVANFVMPSAYYANGILSAKGKYNIANNSSDIQFFASDIDSNIVATEFFKLKDQVKGEAYATLHVITKDKLNDIKAKATFAISDGFLPKIGSQEFIINSSKKPKKQSNSKIVNKLRNKFKDIKITLANITNIDFSKPNIFYSNLYGSFNIDNEDVKNARIFSKSDFLSMFIEGDYNIDSESGNLFIWGQRNKTEAKNIRIFKIPINLIYRVVFRPERTKDMYEDKIKLIPEIKSKLGDDIATFRVYVSGKLNETGSKLKVELKDIR